jgi:hypothetical protein
LARVFDGSDSLRISSGGNESIILEMPIQLEVPYSIASDLAEITSEDVDEVLPPFDVEEGIDFLEDMDEQDE